MAGTVEMIAPDLHVVFLLGLLCVPLSWLVPRALAFDAVAAWTLVCLLLLSPATALWMLAIAGLIPLVMRVAPPARATWTALSCGLVILAFASARLSPGWGWIGGAYVTLRALHVILEWWMQRLPAVSLRDSLRYFLFLPVLVAGPINRLPHFQHQLRRRRWEPDQIWTGAERILLGLVFVYLISGLGLPWIQDLLGLTPPKTTVFWRVWLASAFGWIDLFFLFAGVTHLALGTALMMGLALEENFDRPWRAVNLVDFWTRWHISLTLWVRDYVFRPVLALTRNPAAALILAMLVIGLWHAFSLYYVLWAVWQSLGILLSHTLPRLLTRTKAAPSAIPAAIPAAQTVIGPICVLAWLSAAQPVIGLLLGDLK